MQGSMLLALCLHRSFPAVRSLRLLLDTCTHPQQTQPEVPSTGSQLFRLPQVYRAYILKPAQARVLRYSSQKAEGSCCLLFGVKKYIILKPAFTDSLLRDAEHLLLLLKMTDANHLALTWKVQILTYCFITTWSFKSFWLFDHLHKPRTESKHTHRTISILSLK